jgi:heat shock protein HslJ
VLTSDGTLSGSTGCRELEGEWTERGDELLFTRLAAEGHCSEDLKEQDSHVLSVLGDGFTARIDGQTLMLLSKGELGLGYRAESKQ